MSIEIKKCLGVHICSRCSRALADTDFDHAGLCLNSDPGIFFDYKCPGCEFLGRYTIAISISADSVDQALSALREQLSNPAAPPQPHTRRRYRESGGRDFRRFFRD